MIGRILVGVGAATVGAVAVGVAVMARKKTGAAPVVTAEQKAPEMRDFKLPRVNHLYELKQQRAVMNGEHPLNGWYSQVHWSESLKQDVTIAANKTGEVIVALTANCDGYDVLVYKVGEKYSQAINVLVEHTKKDGDVDGIWPELYVLALGIEQPRSKWCSASDAFYYLANLGRAKQAA